MDGDISLVLRSIVDCQNPDGSPGACPTPTTTGMTLRIMVDSYGVLPPTLLQVIEPTPYPSPKT